MGRLSLLQQRLLANASLTQCSRGVVAFFCRVAERVGLLLLVLHTQCQVTTGLQVIQGFQGVPGYLLVIVVLGVGLSYTPQGTATILMVDLRGLPGVFIEVEVTLGIDMTLAGLQGRSHMPYTVQLVTGLLLVDMARLDDFAVLQLRRIQTVGVVRNVDFLLAVQLPLVTVRCTVVHVEVVGSTQAIGGGTRPVIRHLRGATHATLTGVVQPCQTRLFHLVEGFVHQQYVTGQTRRCSYPLLEVEQHVAFLAGVDTLQRATESELILEVDQAVGTVRLRRRLGYQTLDAAATVAGDMVPDRFQTVLRNRERVGLLEVLQTIARSEER